MDNQSEPVVPVTPQVSPQASPNQPIPPAQPPKKGLSGGIIALIVIGCVVLFGCLIFGVFALILGSFSNKTDSKDTTAELILVESSDESSGQRETTLAETTAEAEITKETDATKTEKTTASSAADSNAPIDIEIDGLRLTYSRHEMTTDYEGKPVLVVIFTFTNNSDEASSAMFSFNVTGFQDGIELDESYFLNTDDPLNDIVSGNNLKEIKKGASIEVGYAFLTTSQSEIEIEASELFNFSDEVWTQIIPFPQ